MITIRVGIINGIFIFLIGALTGRLILNITGETFVISKLLNTEENPPVTLTTHHGFHPIYIYYGKENSVRDLPSIGLPVGGQVSQDKIILELVSLYRNNTGIVNPAPYFIDLAANDAVELSNTLFLEEHGFYGLCVEPNPVYWYRLAHRRCAVAGVFVGNSDLEEVDVSLTNKHLGGIVGDGFDNTKTSLPMEKRYTISMKTLLEQFNVPKIVDYFSLDVEGAEEIVLNTFPFDDYMICFMTIERPKDRVQALLMENGYKYVAPLSSWGETIWIHESVLNKGLTKEQIEDVVIGHNSFAKQKKEEFWQIGRLHY